MKSILLSLSLFAASVASAATYRVTLFQTSNVGGKDLKPGDYKMEVNGNKASFKRDKETVEADVKVESNGPKYSSTSVRYLQDEGKYRIQEIRIGGTTTKVVFD